MLILIKVYYLYFFFKVLFVNSGVDFFSFVDINLEVSFYLWVINNFIFKKFWKFLFMLVVCIFKVDYCIFVYIEIDLCN